MTLAKAAVRDEYREMGVEDEQRALAPVEETQRELPSPIGRGIPANKPPIREPQRRAQPIRQNGKAAPPTPSNGSAKAGS